MTLSALSGSLDGLGQAAPSTGDPDVVAFISAAGIADATQKAAITTLVADMKSHGLWSKMYAIWPMVGGNAAAHKFNLKDPRDLDAAFRLSFFGGWTHSSTGAKPDGSGGGVGTAYADTHFLCDTTHWSSSSGSFGFYTRNSGADQTCYDMGATTAVDDPAFICLSRYGNDHFYGDFGTSSYPFASETDGRGFYVTNRHDTSITNLYKNGVDELDPTDAVTMLSLTLFVGACHKPQAGPTPDGPVYHGVKEHSFDFIADGLTAQNNTDLYTVVQTYQTTLGRRWQDSLGVVKSDPNKTWDPNREDDPIAALERTGRAWRPETE